MKHLLIVTATLVASNPVIANQDRDYSGHRLAAGVSNTVVDYNDGYGVWDYGSGIHLGYGYDFNKIVGINVDYDRANYDYLYYNETLKTLKVTSEIGYAFIFNQWSLKPFGSVGIASSNLDWEIANQSGSESLGTSLVFGFGVRAELRNGVLFELKSNASNESDYDISFGQASLSIGYKF